MIQSFNGLGISLAKPAALLTNPASGFIQLNFAVKDKDGVLPFVTVQVNNEFYSTNEQGQFRKNDIDPNALVTISFVGYRNFTGLAKEIPSTIILNQSTTTLNEVVVKPKSKSWLGLFAAAAVLVTVASTGKEEKNNTRVKIKKA